MTTINIKPRSTALVLIDLMPRIISLDTRPNTGDQVLSRCTMLAERMRAAGGLVVFVRVERPDLADQPPGSELAPECDPGPDDLVLVKRSVGAFATTQLDEQLRRRGIETVVIAGLVTNWGVESTARVADDLGYATVYPVDAMSGLDADAHEFAVGYVLPRLGTVCTAAEIVDALEAQQPA